MFIQVLVSLYNTSQVCALSSEYRHRLSGTDNQPINYTSV